MTDYHDSELPAWTAEDEAALRRANSRWRSWQLGPFSWYNYGLRWDSWALSTCVTPYHFGLQVGPFYVVIMWKEPF